jgi:uncharacterized protein (TIGR02147 family)
MRIFYCMQSIFEFIDYRKFLGAYYKEQKERTHFFSYRYFSKKAGINSPSFLKHVIDGKRNLTWPVIEKFSAALKLTPKEATFFRNLVLFNQAKTAVEKQEHYAVLRSMAGGVKEAVVGADQFDYFSTWYTPVIRELVTMHDFEDDFQRLATMVKPAISASEAKAAVRLLLRLKLIEKRDGGGYAVTSSAVVADSSVTSLAVRSFTQAMLERSREALDTVKRDKRHVSGVTMGISGETYHVLAAEIEAFKDRLKVIVSQDDDADRVYQMTISLFPVSGVVATNGSGKGVTP